MEEAGLVELTLELGKKNRLCNQSSSLSCQPGVAKVVKIIVSEAQIPLFSVFIAAFLE